MPQITDILPEYLLQRHCFTSQQVNLLYGRKVVEECFEEKTRALELTGEILRILDSFITAGVQCIPLKGPVLSYRLYGDPTGRQFSDFDILVNEFSIHQAVPVIESMGYRAESTLWPEQRSKQRRLIRFAHHLIYTHPDIKSRIELHWRLISAPIIRDSNLHRIVEGNLTTIDFFGRKITVLAPEMELIYLVIHGGHHQWSWLKWLADVSQYLKRYSINRDIFLGLSASMKAGRLVALCNVLLEEYFPGCPALPCSGSAPAYLVKFSRKRIESDAITGHDSNWTMLHLLCFFLFAYPGFKYRIRPVVHTLGHSILYGRISRLLSIGPRSVNSEA